ncbi:MAG: hypothetical protein H9W81_09855 [Enterococcus sp.]|nr:hypothetical protein [Enterococcus sp.]
MQKSLQFFARNAEKFALVSIVYFFIMPVFADTLGELFAYTWPAFIIGAAASVIIAMKNTMEIQRADREARLVA